MAACAAGWAEALDEPAPLELSQRDAHAALGHAQPLAQAGSVGGVGRVDQQQADGPAGGAAEPQPLEVQPGILHELLNTGHAHAGPPAVFIQADLSVPGSIDAAATRIARTTGRLDVLVNNSAVFDQTLRKPRFTADGHELFWATNHLGPFLLTARLSPLLAAADRPRVINVASKGLLSTPRIRIRFDQLGDPGWYSPARAYYHAKLAQIMTTFALADKAGGRLEATCVRVPAVRLDPDRVAAMPALLRALYAPKNRFALPAERLGETYARLATRHEPPPSRYVDEDLRPVRAPAFAYDGRARERLWEVSQSATGNPAWAW